MSFESPPAFLLARAGADRFVVRPFPLVPVPFMLAGGFADVRVLLDGLITVDFGSELAMIDSEPGGPGGLVMKGFGVKLEAGSVLAVDCSVSDPMGDPLEGELNIAPEP